MIMVLKNVGIEWFNSIIVDETINNYIKKHSVLFISTEINVKLLYLT